MFFKSSLFRGKRKTIFDFDEPISIDEIRKNSRFLVIDDEDSFPIEFFKHAGYSVEWWNEVKVENIRNLENGYFDLIILDIHGVAKNYSSKDGIGVLEHIKNYNPTQMVVAFSGQSYDLGYNKFWELADDYLNKPVDALQCRMTVDELLKKRYTRSFQWERFKKYLKDIKVSEKELGRIEKMVLRSLAGKKRCTAQEIGDALKLSEPYIKIVAIFLPLIFA